MRESYYGALRIDLVNVLAILTIPAVLFCSGSAASICYSNVAIMLVGAFALIWTIVFLSRNPMLRLMKPAAVTTLLLLFGATASFVFSDFTGWTSWLNFVLAVWLAYLLVRVLGVRATVRGYVRTMELLALVSVVGFLAFDVAGITPPFPRMSSHTGTTTYANALIYVVDLGVNSGRNLGLFWEPSIYAAYINIAFAIVLFHDSTSGRRSRLLVLLIALVTTESAGGFIELACILAAFWYQKGNRVLVLMASIALAALIALTYTHLQDFLLNINYDLFYKFFGGSDSGTTQTRLECPLLNMQIWQQSPIFGSGFYGADMMYNKLRIASSISNLAQTSTVTYLPAAIGIMGFTLFFSCAYGFARLRSLPGISRVLLFVAAMVFLNEEPCTYFVGMYFLLFVLLEIEVVKVDISSRVPEIDAIGV